MRVPTFSDLRAMLPVSRGAAKAAADEQAKQAAAAALAPFFGDGEKTQKLARLMLENPELAPDLLRSHIPDPKIPGMPNVGDMSGQMYGAYKLDQPFRFTVPQPPYRKPGQEIPITVQQCRLFAQSCEVLRAAMNQIKREVWQTQIRFTPRPGGDWKGAPTAMREARGFFDQQGGLGKAGTFRLEFESALLEDAIVVGAGATYFSPSRGGKPYEAINIDAATIRPKLDAFGWQVQPFPWEQWIYGVKVAEFTDDEILHKGLFTKSNTPYPDSMVEYLISTCINSIKSDEWNRLWITEGNTPAQGIALPEKWSIEQIKDYAAWFVDQYSGNNAGRQKLRFFPSGSQMLMGGTRKDQDFQEWEYWLAQKIGSVTGIHMPAIGMGESQYKVQASKSMSQSSAYGVGAYLLFRRQVYNNVLIRLGLYDAIEVRDVGVPGESPAERADRNYLSVSVGSRTRNEVREEDDLDPITGGEVMTVPHTAVPLSMVLQGATVPGPPGSKSPQGGGQEGDPAHAGLRQAGRAMKQSHDTPPSFLKPTLPTGTAPAVPPMPNVGLRVDDVDEADAFAWGVPAWGVPASGAQRSEPPPAVPAEPPPPAVPAQPNVIQLPIPLLRWREEALRRIEHGCSPLCAPPFGVPDHQAAPVFLSLRRATTHETVTRAFELGPETLTTTDVRRDISLWMNPTVGGWIQTMPQSPGTPPSKAPLSRIYLVADTLASETLISWQDPHLDGPAKQLAARIGAQFATAGVAQVYCSDLTRAQETAAIIGRASGYTGVNPGEGWRPWDLGTLTGETLEQAQGALGAYVRDRPQEDTPGGESYNDFRARFLQTLYATMRSPGGPVLIVTHPDGLALADAWLAASGPPGWETVPDTFLAFEYGPGDLLALDRNANTGAWEVVDEIGDTLDAAVAKAA
jgi:broad specificity phosphatase PhoE